MKIIKKDKWRNLIKAAISTLIVALLAFNIGCSTYNKSTQSNTEISQPKYSPKVQKAIEECNKGGYEGYAGAMLVGY